MPIFKMHVKIKQQTNVHLTENTFSLVFRASICTPHYHLCKYHLSMLKCISLDTNINDCLLSESVSNLKLTLFDICAL